MDDSKDADFEVETDPVVGTALAARQAGPVAAPVAGDLFGMVASYAERGIAFPIESLERLIALQERAQERNARDAFFRALADFQEEVPPIRPAKVLEHLTRVTNDGRRVEYFYATLGQVATVIRPGLAKHGLSYSWDSALSDAVLSVTCTLRHIDGHAESSTFSCPTATPAKMSEAQKVGAALTYARRQSLVQVCGLSMADQDTDGAEPEAAETVTEEQVDILRGLIMRTGSAEARLLKLYGVEEITALPARLFPAARGALEERLAKMEAKDREGAA